MKGLSSNYSVGFSVAGLDHTKFGFYELISKFFVYCCHSNIDFIKTTFSQFSIHRQLLVKILWRSDNWKKTTFKATEKYYSVWPLKNCIETPKSPFHGLHVTFAMLVSQTSPVEVEVFCWHVSAFFCCNKFAATIVNGLLPHTKKTINYVITMCAYFWVYA